MAVGIAQRPAAGLSNQIFPEDSKLIRNFIIPGEVFIFRFCGFLQQEFELDQPRAHQAKGVVEGVDQAYLDAGGEVDGVQVGQAVEGDGLLRPDATFPGGKRVCPT